MTDSPTPVVFIHGLWLHASSWQTWVDLFRENGYDPIAPGRPGDELTVEATRANTDAVSDHGIEEVTDHYASIIDALPSKPIVIGHSFGGLIAQKLLGQDKAIAGIGIDAAQMKGVLPLPLSALKVAGVVLHNPTNAHKAVALTKKQFKYGFGNAIPDEESDELFEKWTIPSPGKPLFQADSANFNPRSEARVDTKNNDRGPLLLITGGKDHTVPEAVVKAEYKQYRHSDAVTELFEFPDRGHSLAMDHGWREVADKSLSWLKEQGL